MTSHIAQRVREIIAEQLGMNEEDITPEANFLEDLGADSLDIVELIMAMEEEFEVEIPDEDAERLLTVQQTVDYIREKADG